MADDKLTFTFTKKATKRQLDSGSSVQFRHDKTESGHERDFILAVSDKEIERSVTSAIWNSTVPLYNS